MCIKQHHKRIHMYSPNWNWISPESTDWFSEKNIAGFHRISNLLESPPFASWGICMTVCFAYPTTTTRCFKFLLSVWSGHFFYFHFYAWFGIHIIDKGGWELSTVQRWASNSQYWWSYGTLNFRRRAQNTKIGRKLPKIGPLDPSFYFFRARPLVLSC